MKKVRYDCRPTERTVIRSMKTTFPVFSYRVAYQLVADGYEPTKVEVNRKYPGVLVYWFEDLPETRAYIPTKNEVK